MIQPRISFWTTIAALALIGPGSFITLQGQELPHPFASLRYTPTEDTTARSIVPIQLSDSTSIPETYWLEGALIGGTVAGILIGALAGGFCSDSDSGGGNEPCWDDMLLGAAVGLAAGGSLGALVGGQFKKRPKGSQQTDEEREPVAQDSSESSP
jgi:hypothetical protein